MPNGEPVNTVGNFWHMIWDQHCDRIAMVTNLLEGNKVKTGAFMW